ncbi:hypothetical protein AMTRI_Chr02g264770 [Amborella trichopoda]
MSNSKNVSLYAASAELESLTEAERRALRSSRFSAPPLPPPPQQCQPRLAHPGGPVATNKAAALAKFLERKLQDPGGLDSINPHILEVAVKNAKDTLRASGSSIRHVSSFSDSTEESGKSKGMNPIAEEGEERKGKKKKKRKKKHKGMKVVKASKSKKKKKKF